jgi:signal-transduction protein with cAMP-binding, CBS, and nucleotidyltransferase domain
MTFSYRLAQRGPGNGLTPASLRTRPLSRRLKRNDPALHAMTDFLRDPPLTVAETIHVEDAVDQMFRLGVRSFLVVRDGQVIGLMTAWQAARSPRHHVAVTEVMTPTDDAPAIDWSTLGQSQVEDLLEIFDGSGVEHLVVMESHSATLNSVRGLVYRERLRRLTSPWALQQPLM